MNLTPRTGWRAKVSALGAFAAATLLAGCTFAVEPPSGAAAYPNEIAQAQERASSDFENAVLADGDIEASEYQEAMNLFYECVRARGIEVQPTVSPAGIHTFSLTGLGIEAAVDECAVGTTAIIEPLFSMITANPQNRDLNELTAECLVAVGFVEGPFSRTDFIREYDTSEFIQRAMDDADAYACLNNPNHHNVTGSR